MRSAKQAVECLAAENVSAESPYLVPANTSQSESQSTNPRRKLVFSTQLSLEITSLSGSRLWVAANRLFVLTVFHHFKITDMNSAVSW